jgi:hypothetical protein
LLEGTITLTAFQLKNLGLEHILGDSPKNILTMAVITEKNQGRRKKKIWEKTIKEPNPKI